MHERLLFRVEANGLQDRHVSVDRHGGVDAQQGRPLGRVLKDARAAPAYRRALQHRKRRAGAGYTLHETRRRASLIKLGDVATGGRGGRAPWAAQAEPGTPTAPQAPPEKQRPTAPAAKAGGGDRPRF